MSVMDSHVETLDELFRNIEDGKTPPDQVEEELKEAEELVSTTTLRTQVLPFHE